MPPQRACGRHRPCRRQPGAWLRLPHSTWQPLSVGLLLPLLLDVSCRLLLTLSCRPPAAGQAPGRPAAHAGVSAGRRGAARSRLACGASGCGSQDRRQLEREGRPIKLGVTCFLLAPAFFYFHKGYFVSGLANLLLLFGALLALV